MLSSGKILCVAALLCSALLLASASEAHTLPNLQVLFESTGLAKQVSPITEEEKSLINQITDIYEADDISTSEQSHAEHLERLGELTLQLTESVKAASQPPPAAAA